MKTAVKTGDLIFSCIGPLDDPIQTVTQGYRGARVNHVGVAVESAKGIFVLEAFPPEVRLTNIEVFERRSCFPPGGAERLMYGRLKAQYRPLIPKAIEYGIAQRDIPYDQLYLDGAQALYCSELVVDMFRAANHGDEFFPEKPMSFRDPATGEILKAWADYYAYFGMEVPQGAPGSNPGDVSKDPNLDIYSVVGTIPGYS